MFWAGVGAGLALAVVIAAAVAAWLFILAKDVYR